MEMTRLSGENSALVGILTGRRSVQAHPGGQGRRARSEFCNISPLGQVPALVLPDGHAMTESTTMRQLIAKHHPSAQLAPVV